MRAPAGKSGWWRLRPLRFLGDSRAVVALEFAIISIPFFMFVLFTFEITYDLYTQEALDYGVGQAIKHLARGEDQNATSGTTFLTNSVCPYFGSLLECNTTGSPPNLYINIQKFPATGAQDYYDITTGVLPMSGNQLNLANFEGTGSFCNVAPYQFVLVSVIYIGPSFIGHILPNLLSEQLGGKTVHATLSTSGFATERFTHTQPPSGTTAASSC